jgi:4-hydroxy 2-oxovalerate aldolase
MTRTIQTEILDTTIRDGSYAVNFKFTCTDVKNIVAKLVKLGVKYIEIGHGFGLNASSPERGISLFSDVEYIDAARECSQDKKLGMFCIPGIARFEDLTMAKEHGISFVRIGVTVEKISTAIEYVEVAKSHGLTIMVNFMKSYASTPEAFSESTKIAYAHGADFVYLVDSAGCMLPEEIEQFSNAAKEKCPDARLGFHGHNNLGMSVPNSLKCVELGFALVDTSFQGLGRSIGNTPTEMYVMALKRKYGNNAIDMDIPRLLEYGYVALKDISNRNLNNPLDLICGYTGFHSSYIKDIYQCCNKVGVDPLRLIMAYTLTDKVNMDTEKLYEIARSLPEDESADEHPYSFRNYFSDNYGA